MGFKTYRSLYFISIIKLYNSLYNNNLLTFLKVGLAMLF